MIRGLFPCMLVIFSLSAGAFAAEEDPSPANRSNRIGLELLGKGFVGSIAYERRFGARLAGGLGLGFFPGSAGDSSDALTIPAYVHYDFSEDQRGAYLFGGADILLTYPHGGSNGKLFEFVDQRVVPIWGGGYQHVSDGGFLFRVGLSFIVVIPLPGVTFGIAF